MKTLFTWGIITIAMVLSAALFGFFYAWVCSTMWGLDTAPPDVAIQAMQAMNGSVRNMVFAPAFFGTPCALILAGGLVWRAGVKDAAALFGVAGLVILLGGVGLTMSVNVPMNEALAVTAVPDDPIKSAQIWTEYSQGWQVWNQIRTVLTGIGFLIGLAGVARYSSGLSAN